MANKKTFTRSYLADARMIESSNTDYLKHQDEHAQAELGLEIIKHMKKGYKTVHVYCDGSYKQFEFLDKKERLGLTYLGQKVEISVEIEVEGY